MVNFRVHPRVPEDSHEELAAPSSAMDASSFSCSLLIRSCKDSATSIGSAAAEPIPAVGERREA